MATSDVPPPISITMLPLGLSIATPAPNAAAIGTSISFTTLAPADRSDSLIALYTT